MKRAHDPNRSKSRSLVLSQGATSQVQSRLLTSGMVSPGYLSCPSLHLNTALLFCPTSIVRFLGENLPNLDVCTVFRFHHGASYVSDTLPVIHFLCISNSHCAKAWVSCLLYPKQLQCSLFPLPQPFLCMLSKRLNFCPCTHESDCANCIPMRPKQHDFSLGCGHSCPLQWPHHNSQKENEAVDGEIRT